MPALSQAFIRDPQIGLTRYCEYLNSWAPYVRNGQSLILTYERLHQSPEKTVADLLAFLKIPLAENLVQEAVRLSSFEAMQTLEKQTGMPGLAMQDDPESQRMRRGK